MFYAIHSVSDFNQSQELLANNRSRLSTNNCYPCAHKTVSVQTLQCAENSFSKHNREKWVIINISWQ